jgi:hypothetical protein
VRCRRPAGNSTLGEFRNDPKDNYIVVSSSYVTNGRLLINEEMGVEGGGDALKSRADTLYVCGERIYFAVPPGYVDKILRRAKPP